MKGDFSRITYNERKHYSLVLMQQGRVQLDSDWNEQGLHHWFGLQRLGEDLMGEHGGPSNHAAGFDIMERKDENGNLMPLDFTIGAGRYYVRGVVCENEAEQAYTGQEAYPFFYNNTEIVSGKRYLVYLHTWWRHITSVEDEGIREVALGGPDTASRIQTVWQVKLVQLPNTGAIQDFKTRYGDFMKLLEDKTVIKATTGKLQAQARKPTNADQPCLTSPESRYRGHENQLYRVEIHRGGPACNSEDSTTSSEPCATFKWSRDNGSVVLPVVDRSAQAITLAHLGRDDGHAIKVGDWVELVDDAYEIQRRAEAIVKVIAVDPDTLRVTLSDTPAYELDLSKNPLLRRWDHTGGSLYEGAIPVEEGKWIELEDGVQIQFSKPGSESNSQHYYQSGAWWWIPARTASGDVEWPRENDQPLEQGSLDAGDRYAPLALVETKSTGTVIKDYRRKFRQLWE